MARIGASSVRSPGPRGFTLIELLVVIGIIALLMGILLPVVSRARRQARQTEELVAVRQLMIAHLIYSQANDGALIPGRIDVAMYPGMAVTDDAGAKLTPPEAANRWPWRLLASVRQGPRGTLLVNEQESRLADRNQPLWSYLVSVYPSFGMNCYEIGGDLEAPLQNHAGYLRQITRSRNATRLIVFASARADAEIQGYFALRPPAYRMRTWPTAQRWPSTPFAESDAASAWGYVHPRWDGRAVVGCLDGHAEMLTVDELRDMTRWSETAARAGEANWTP